MVKECTVAFARHWQTKELFTSVHHLKVKVRTMQCMFTEFFIVVTVTSENFQRYGHGHRRGGYLQHCRPVKSKNPHMCHLSFNSWHSLTEYILNYFLFFKLLSILSIVSFANLTPTWNCTMESKPKCRQLLRWKHWQRRKNRTITPMNISQYIPTTNTTSVRIKILNVKCKIKI